MRRPTRFLTAAFVLFCAVAAPASATTIVRSGDAAISHDGATWVITAGGATLTLGLDAARDFTVVSLVSPSKTSWAIGSLPDTIVDIAGQTLSFGSRASGFTFLSADAHQEGSLLRLDALFELPRHGLRVTRHYRVASGTPTFEVWTSYSAIGDGSTSVSNLNAFRLTVPTGTLHWLNGLKGDNADVAIDDAFTLGVKQLETGDHFAIGAERRSSEQSVPWIAIDGPRDEFYAALMWSGAWKLTADRTGNGLTVNVDLGAMSTSIRSTSVDGPHAVYGVATGGLSDASAALRSFVISALRAGRPLDPLVTYNTWFSYGTNIDDASMRAEMERAAALGVELFVIDAGWYAGAGASGPFDFDSGLGSWQPDPARFPNGLKPLTDYAHALGMKFGLWVEPERVDRSTMHATGADEAWLATTGGSYGSETMGQICLASDAARAWLLARLTTLLDDVQPDYLKWDNNMFINCDRAGHGHGAADGNFAHVTGLYELLGLLRERYPNMQIENVSGGGNRLDLGMLRYTDVAWMDDRTAPSVHVRHNVQGLSALFPPAYLLSFVTDHYNESIHDSADLPLYVRSRMEGTLGFSIRSGELSEGQAADIARQIEIFASMRQTLSGAAATLLTPQASSEGGPAWDALEAVSADSQEIVLTAVQSDPAVESLTVKPTLLDPKATYSVQSVDVGPLGTATGADLMADGIEIVASPNSAAHILFIKAQQ